MIDGVLYILSLVVAAGLGEEGAGGVVVTWYFWVLSQSSLS